MKDFFKKIIVFILTIESKIVLFVHKPLIIAVSGSVGKTTTKDALYTVLSETLHSRKSQKSFNSDIGVPLTILGLENAEKDVLKWATNILLGFFVFFERKYPKVLVLEVGADHKNDIKKMRWLRPHAVVYTRFPLIPAHIEFFSSAEEVIEEKRELLRAMRDDGFLFINADDEKMKNEILKENQKHYSYGFSESADMRIILYSEKYTKENTLFGSSVNFLYQKKYFSVEHRGILGKHYAYSSAVAILLAEKMFSIPPSFSAELLSKRKSSDYPKGRMRLFNGIHDSCIIDDSYNASPASMSALIETVKKNKMHGRKILILGDMMELGEHSLSSHKKIGEEVKEGIDIFIAVGVRMKDAYTLLQKEGGKCVLKWFSSSLEAGEYAKGLIKKGDLIGVKGSRHAMRMEKAVRPLLQKKEDKKELLS